MQKDYSKLKMYIFLSIIPILIVGTLLASPTSCIRQVRRDYEEEARIRGLIEKAWYGRDMGFGYRIFYGGEIKIFRNFSAAIRAIHPQSDRYDPFHTDIVFVHTKEEAANFPEHVIVGWPSSDDSTERIIERINREINRTEEELMTHYGRRIRPVINLEKDFGLTYPITRADLVDNWEKINDLWLVIERIRPHPSSSIDEE